MNITSKRTSFPPIDISLSFQTKNKETHSAWYELSSEERQTFNVELNAIMNKIETKLKQAWDIKNGKS